MGLLLTKLFRIFWSQEEVKIVIVGLDNAGKTTGDHKKNSYISLLMQKSVF